ncbi:fused DSP-PTPase phosphatase/NAD kinase-like protein [Tundrisphaera sp. TA3]|uniref:fused DSP-PTPase phosphatase/NAD kinase-like protein n=1 Tax=Tundrisphaera sp. TA3 TaxID=3435775 RepID=UPI003EBD203B
MTMNRSSAGGLPKGSLAPRRWAKPPGLGLLALALIALAQVGCRSDGCSTCGLGGIGTKLSNGVQALGSRFHQRGATVVTGGGGCCGGGAVEEGLIIDGGVPVTPVVPVVPGGLIPAPVETGPTELQPLDPKPAGPSPTGAVSTPSTSQNRLPVGANRSAYEANRKASPTRSRYGDVARAVHTPSSPGNGAAAGGASNFLDHLPPVDLSTDVTSKAVVPVGNVPAPAVSPDAKDVAPAPEARPAAAPVAENLSAAEGADAALPRLAAPIASSATPGIVRCSSVEPHLMGGSLPTVEGLDWLKQRGYKTFLDLRARTEVDPAFVDSVSDRGLVYVALPILANRLDSARLARFDDLVSQSEARPLYFCDTDGSRAGLAWYIHRMTVDHYDAQAAEHEAIEVGLPGDRLAEAKAYLAAQGVRSRMPTAAAAMPAPAPAPAPTPAPAPKPAEKPAPAPVAAEPAPSPPPARTAEVELPPSASFAMSSGEGSDNAPESEQVEPPVIEAPPIEATPVAASPAPAPAPEPTTEPASDMSDVLRPQANAHRPEIPFDPKAWKSVATLVLAFVGLPLAYWSRSALSLARSSRANRKAKGPRSIEARPSSDA